MPVIRKLDNVTIQNRIFNFRVVDSSNVDRIGWPVTGEPLMLVHYHHGGEYGYIGVSRQRAVAAAHAESVGQYIHEKIKGHYKPVKLS